MARWPHVCPGVYGLHHPVNAQSDFFAAAQGYVDGRAQGDFPDALLARVSIANPVILFKLGVAPGDSGLRVCDPKARPGCDT